MKTIWIMNHYATQMFYDKAGRHYWFAKQLKARGYKVVVFCANTFLKNNNFIDTNKKLFIQKIDEETNIPFIFVKTKPCEGNGIDRVCNMLFFSINLVRIAHKISRMYGSPDVILASSVHPLTLIAGIRIGRKFKVPCICEIRDLWPEGIFSTGKLKEKSLIGKLLIKGEYWIYKKAHALIFTKEGDTDYLKERKWTTLQGGKIDLDKCYYINNGVDLENFLEKQFSTVLEDNDLENTEKFKVVYAGIIRPTNNVGNILDAAIIVKNKGYENIQFLIYGDGFLKEELVKRVNEEKITNVLIKGFVDRKYIPYVLSKSNINILNYAQNQYNWTRGNSSNKLFEYMASGKPIISTVRMGYSIINKYKCGVELEEDTPQCLADQIIRFYNMDKKEYETYGINAKEGAKDFDFNVLTDKLERVINEVL